VHPSRNDSMSSSRVEAAVDIEKIIDLAKKKFILPEVPEQPLLDAYFNGYDAHRIHKHSHYIAGAGPKQDSMSVYFTHIICNQHVRVEHIIALGHYLGCAYDPEHEDFPDYCVQPRELKYPQHTLHITSVSGTYRTYAHGLFSMPNDIVQSKLTVTPYQGPPREINVTVLALMDGRGIQLHEKSDDYKDKLLKLFELSLEKYIFIHCKAGQGRTGHVVLMFELLKNYQKIFSQCDPQIIADNIAKLLTFIRKIRPVLIHNNEQFTSAIRNAHTLYWYGLRKNYQKIFDEAEKTAIDFNELEEKEELPTPSHKEIAVSLFNLFPQKNTGTPIATQPEEPATQGYWFLKNLCQIL
jgi:protein tyrosine phosphatase